jgi:hypothetical protein
MKKFLCIVIERHSKKQLMEYTITADDWYYARHMAANKFRNEIDPPKELDWCVDSLELDS